MPVARDPRLFRLTALGTAFNLLVACVLIVPGAVILWMRPEETMGVLVGAFFVLSGCYLAWRVLIWRVHFDDDAVRVVGLLWSRTISRSQVVAIAPEIGQPTIVWRSRSGRVFVAPLNVVALGNIPLLPPRARRRRIDFMSMLDSWANELSLEESERDLAARARSHAEEPTEGSRREWRARHGVIAHRSDPFVEIAEWVSPPISALLVFAALGIARRGEPAPLPVSAGLTLIAASLLAVLTMLVLSRRSVRRAPRALRRWFGVWPGVSGTAGVVILILRAEQGAGWGAEVFWAIGACVVAVIASVVAFCAGNTPVASGDVDQGR